MFHIKLNRALSNQERARFNSITVYQNIERSNTAGRCTVSVNVRPNLSV